MLFGFIFAAIISASLASATSLSMPAVPDKFFGTVKLDGANVSAGNIITITVGSDTDTYNMTQSGYYELYVKKGVQGDAINFYINGTLYGTRTRTGGTTESYDLSYTTPATNPPASPPSGGGGGSGPTLVNFCGDKKCNSPAETSENCPSDCAIQTKPIEPCSENWTCTQWSECSIATSSMERRCTDTSSCNTAFQKPAEQKSCIPAEMQNAKAIIDRASHAVNSTPAIAFLNDARAAYIDGNYTLAAELAERALNVDALSSKADNSMPTALAFSQTSKNAGIVAGIIVLFAAAVYYLRKKY